jgi:hypothetical protein
MKNRKHHILIYYVVPMMVFITLIGLAFALAPPPVDQRIGVYDTLFANLTEFKCRNCHTSGGTVYDPANITKSTDSVPGRHHLLVASGQYACTNCHPVIEGQDITMIRDCVQCHDTVFNNITIRRPHHETLDAQERHCSKCHGNLVDDYDDGHYIPPYNVSDVTPDTKFKVINQSSGKKWGGCEACHEQNLTLDPPIAFNNKTHHRLGSLSGFNPPNVTKCAACHDTHSSQYGPDFIRYCERCHAVKSLHNIQYDYANTSGILGNGHIGANWDCNGCHAWYVAGNAPGTDIIVPNIETISTNKVLEGDTTLFTIKGTNFVTTIGSVTHSSVVVITDGTTFNTITPTSINSNTITLTIPSLSRGAYGIYALNNGSVKSNKFSLVSVPKVVINSAKKSGSIITITGSGFGTYDPVYKSYVNVTIKNKAGTTTRSISQVNNWTDTLIKVTSSDTVVGDNATVNSIYGSKFARVAK